MTLGVCLGAAATTIATGGLGAPAAVGAGVAAHGALVAGAAATTELTLVGAASVGATWGVALGGPVGAFVLCFDENTRVRTSSGEVKRVADLKVDEKILAQETQNLSSESMEISPSVATVKRVDVVEGEFTAHELVFDQGESLTVTSPHFMAVDIDGQMKVVRASQVKVGHKMYRRDNTMIKVVETKPITLNRKVNVETSTGTLFANNIFTTAICENGTQKMYDIKEFFDLERATHIHA